MRVCLVENPQWVVRGMGEPVGPEVDLAHLFASRFAARPQWFWGGEQKHMEALRRFELDLVVGGLDDRTPWPKSVGITRPDFVPSRNSWDSQRRERSGGRRPTGASSGSGSCRPI